MRCQGALRRACPLAPPATCHAAWGCTARLAQKAAVSVVAACSW
jgi:hypothetical protein